MVEGMKRFKPGVSRRTHAACAAVLWSGIGIFLLLRGVILLRHTHLPWLIGVGVVLGSLKSLYVLDHMAVKGITRIKHFADNTCLGALYSWKTWLLVATMMSVGMLLRLLKVSPLFIGTMCSAVGWSLGLSSRHAWNAWWNWKREN